MNNDEPQRKCLVHYVVRLSQKAVFAKAYSSLMILLTQTISRLFFHAEQTKLTS